MTSDSPVPHDPADRVTEDATLTTPTLASLPGSAIGPYRLVRQIGEGGMGVVFHAQQSQPLRRDVALKLIKPGMDSKQVIARFEGERQALALMDHPNIARVFDAGTTEAGLPYFVMEYVDGSPITRYCDVRRLPLRERLELFIPVCRAIQHAHQKGIIHRDLKPSNILVGQKEGQPAPKVIDFGLAKALGGRLSDATLMTGVGAVVGTLQYMSPEQAELGKQDIDTRSDIYSLGAVLYELVTGSTPLEAETLTKSGYLEILGRIREEEPAAPSARARRAANSEEIAQGRKSDPDHYSKLLHGELDWIVLKALEKDRSRRYETANGLARDLERYLSGEPLEAAPASATYRIRKLVRKHRAWLATAAAFVALLLGGVVVSTWMAVRATRAEQDAVRERNAAKAVSDFLQNDLLAQASSTTQATLGVKPDPDLRVRTALDRASVRIEGKFASQPLVEASVRHTIGATYERLGSYAEALRHAERALELRRRELGEQNVDTAASMRLVATVKWDQGRYAEAESLTTQALEIQRRTLGEEHPNTLNSLNTLAAAVAYQGRYAEAEALFTKALAAQKRVFGEENSQTLYVMNNVAATQFRQGKFAQAEESHAKALAIRRRAQGDEHPGTLTSLSNLGEALQAEGKYAEAAATHARALEVRRRALGDEHPDTLVSLRNLAATFLAEGKYAQSKPLLEKALETRARVLGPEHPRTLSTMADLAALHRAEGRAGEAVGLLKKTLDLQRRVLGVAHPETLDTLLLLGETLLRQSKEPEAVPVLREALAGYEKKDPDTAKRHKAQSLLGAALVRQGNFTEAEPLLLAGYRGLSDKDSTLPAADRLKPLVTVEPIIQMYEKAGKPEQAAEWKRKLAAAGGR